MSRPESIHSLPGATLRTSVPSRPHPSGSLISRKREASELSRKLDKSLVTYALAASTAGVGIMALTQAAEAKIIATPAHIPIPINGGVIQFDINGDGIPDFGLSAAEFANSSTLAPQGKRRPPLGGIAAGHLNVVPAQAANEVGVLGGFEFRPFAAALPPGIQIGAGRHFDAGTILMAGIIVTGCGGSSLAYGNWKGTHPPHAYLPVKFNDAGGELHYGWVRISVTESGAIDFNATIDGYAYETVPNKPIISGATSGPVGETSFMEPASSLKSKGTPAASLGLLALGARGLTAWRKEDNELEKVA